MKNAEENGSLSGKTETEESESSLHSNTSQMTESDFRKWPEEQYEEVSEYIKQVDEILDLINPSSRKAAQSSEAARSVSQMEAPRLGYNHLENLIKLVEQLKDLKERNSRVQERAQYLKDLKRIRERKKRLKYEAEMQMKQMSPPKYWQAERKDEVQVKKSKSSLPFRKNSRGRSKSVNMEEYDKEKEVCMRRERFPSEEQTSRRKSSNLLQKMNAVGNKAKVSKWTKVKEAFRWEKASHSMVESRPKSNKRDEVQYLQVPQDKTSESPSDSALSGQISASSSVGAPSTSCLAAVSSGYSGEHSSEGHSTSSGYALDLLLPPPPPPPPPQLDDDYLPLPLLQDLSSSSSSEKLDELLTYTELLTEGKSVTAALLTFTNYVFLSTHAKMKEITFKST